ncbi:tetratricopeptide repeat protein [Streptosporangium vulgare]|uniref:tetratricopeptide repeat protein n=1 Tax=Streptosporangium vulgare TaxID=46190 RepID=UPI0031E07677
MLGLGELALAVDQTEQAIGRFHQALGLFHKINAPLHQVRVLVMLSAAYIAVGEAEAALSVSEEALELAATMPPRDRRPDTRPAGEPSGARLGTTTRTGGAGPGVLNTGPSSVERSGVSLRAGRSRGGTDGLRCPESPGSVRWLRRPERRAARRGL